MTRPFSHSALWGVAISEGGAHPGGGGRLATRRQGDHATADHHTIGRDIEFQRGGLEPGMAHNHARAGSNPASATNSRVGRHSAPNRPTLRRRMAYSAGAPHPHRARAPNGSTQQSVPQRVTAGSVSASGGRGSLALPPQSGRVDLQPRCLSLATASLHRVGLAAGATATAARAQKFFALPDEFADQPARDDANRSPRVVGVLHGSNHGVRRDREAEKSVRVSGEACRECG